MHDEQTIRAQAAEWLVRLSSDDDTEDRSAVEHEFESWKQRDPLHAEAALALEVLIGRVRHVGAGNSALPGPARRALEHSVEAIGRRRERLRRNVRMAVLCLLLSIPVWLFFRAYPAAVLLADVSTPAGQWQQQKLADGTLLALDGNTAVDIELSGEHRIVKLLQGRIWVDVAPDPSRPFVVETPFGDMQALGTRFIVSLTPEAAQLTMLESSVSIQPSGHVEARVLEAGQQIAVTAVGYGPQQRIDAITTEQAWHDHQLIVQDRPLPEVLAELGRHRRGYLLFDAQALARYRVSAVLPLDRPEQALQLLQRSFPDLRLHSMTSYLTWIGVQQP
ncbi:MAG: FecR domain-containing protein [Corticimicrobacter sp.]|uniref:FecR family protein n=1 Tax=Corticimicrobacter sp. TaxID=2678536 RepID=UPI0032DB92C3